MRKSVVPKIALLALLACSAHAAVNVTTQKGDSGRSGLTPSETTLTPSTVNSNTFGLLFERSADGDMYPQPLIVSGLSIGGGTHNVVYLATAANYVYAYDADDATLAAPYWSKSLGTPVPATEVDCCCTDIANVVGVIGTPVIDAASKTMYVVAKVKNPDATYHQWLHALDLTTGAEKFSGPVEITAIVSGTNAFSAKLNNQRPGLLLQGGNVYVGWSSHNDCGAYHGIIVAFNASTLAQVAAWNDTPTGTKGGIWMSGGGLVGDGTHIYFSTGNGDYNAASGGQNYSQSIVGLDNSLNVVTYYTPTTWSSLNSGDNDLGGCGLLLIPGTRLLVTVGKDQFLYLVNADTMGGLGGQLQRFDVGAGHGHGGPVAFNSTAGLLVYMQPESTKLEAYKMVNGLFSPTNAFWTSAVAAPNGMPGGQLWVSGTGADGILWETIPYSSDANHATVAGILRAYNPSTGAEIYNSYQNKTRDDFGNFAKNPSPVVANGKVYVPTFSGSLAVYGLLSTNNPPQLPLQPTSVKAAAARQPGKITVTWVQSPSNGITQNKVYRSTTGAGGPYLLAATIAPNTTYSQTGLTSGATYYYVVTAVTSVGESPFSNPAGATAN
jgi:hypothetical protein